ncbi:hypothetical protein [uncultured Devosia sp.]|uniref:hypothetical protein n=1 Tax=uncultured Devosia sp. TaxID=211434 RepID=UPI0035CC2338
MHSTVENTPYLALVDDDAHSARMLTRVLLAHGSPRVELFGESDVAMEQLMRQLAGPVRICPTLVLVDLKSHSDANLEFVTALSPMATTLAIPIAVMAQQADRHIADALHHAGAAAVFLRHADLPAYRREAANIVSFWARSQRLDTVGM